jgi:hypothetical protein
MKQAPLMTDWAQQVDTNAPLPEYPRPQMVRSNWLNLNGIWQFQSGATNDPVPTNQILSTEILVPFPMESAISGVKQYYPRSWYRRTLTVPPAWSGQHILLHLDAVDWESQPFINGQSAGIHRGGYDAATYDITPYLADSGPQELIVRVYDPTDSAGEPRGKQTLYPGGIMYTSCSGIWQPVWIEPVPATSIASLRLVPDIDNNRLIVAGGVSGPTNGITVNAIARVGSNVVGSVSGAPGVGLLLPVPGATLWSPTNPFLYDLDVTLSNGVSRVDAGPSPSLEEDSNDSQLLYRVGDRVRLGGERPVAGEACIDRVVDRPILEHYNPVSTADGRKSVGDHEHGAPKRWSAHALRSILRRELALRVGDHRERDEPTTQFMADQLPGKEVVPERVEQGQASHEHRDTPDDCSHLAFVFFFLIGEVLVKSHTLRIGYTTETAPAATYGVVGLGAAVAFTILVRAIIRADGSSSLVATAIGSDTKGRVSLLAYAAATVLAFVSPWISYALFIAVAVMWFIPDRRLSRVSTDV